MISIITFINLFVLAFAHHQIARSWGSPAWHLEQQNPWASQVVAGLTDGSAITGNAVQWQDSPALSQWQEDAAASLPYSLPNHNGHSHYPPYFPQSQPQMNNFGQPGFSPYGTPFHYVRTVDLTRSPKYTTVLKHLDEAARAMTKHVSTDTDGKLTDAQIQYVMVLTAINDLMDDMINMGPEAYSLRYKTVIEDAIAKVEKNPLASAISIKTRIIAMKSLLTGITNLIKLKQSDCTEPISPECDKIIDQAVDQSKDAELQTAASYLVALADSMELFSRDYLVEVAQVANAHGAANFLVHAEEKLKPLVLAGVEARKMGLQVKLLPLLRSNNNHLNRFDNALQYLRNRNQ